MDDLRVAVFGLGRGAYLATVAAAMEGVRVVAGCDAHPTRLARFRERFPEATIVPTYEDLLALPVDALILASFCPDHAPQAIRALEAGVHVLSEVTAFHTPAQGVALVEAVERTGLTYMMAENACFRPRAFEAARLLREGDLGQFVYGECEYIHDIRRLMRNPDGTPHAWRSWLPPLYYATHPLGEMLHILGARAATATGHTLGGLMEDTLTPVDWGTMTLLLEDGGIVQVKTSFAAARDSQWLSIYGTRAVVESDRRGDPNRIHVRAEGAPLSDREISYLPRFPLHAAEAARTGHGGADYYAVYHFLQALREGTRPAIDVYRAADFTLPGIMAHRSALQGGVPVSVPDLRDPAARDRYRADDAGPSPSNRGAPGGVHPLDASPRLPR